MKKLIFIVLIAAFVSFGVSYFFVQLKGRNNLGGGGNPTLITLVGSATDAEHLPANIYVFADSTSTDPTFDGGLVTQRVLTTGADTVRLNFAAVGSVSTSTVDVSLRGSVDGISYFDMMYSTSTPNIMGNGTTTPTITRYTTTFVPGVATSTWSYDYNVIGTNYVIFLFKSNDTAHLNLGAQAFIQAVPNYVY